MAEAEHDPAARLQTEGIAVPDGGDPHAGTAPEPARPIKLSDEDLDQIAGGIIGTTLAPPGYQTSSQGLPGQG